MKKLTVNDAKKVADAVIAAMRAKHGKRYNYDRLCYREDGELSVAIEIADDAEGKKIPRKVVSELKAEMKRMGCLHCESIDVVGDQMPHDVALTRVYSVLAEGKQD